MNRLFASLILWAFVIANAMAAEVHFSWSTPDKREDGSPLDPTEISKYTIYFATGQVLADITSGGSNQYVQTLSLDDGETVCFQITATDTAGRESQKSTLVEADHCHTYMAPPPGVPTEFRAVFEIN